MSSRSTLHYIHYITLHYTTLHYTTLHYTTLHCTALHCTALHCTALHCTALHCTALHCTALHYITLHYITLHLVRFFPIHISFRGSIICRLVRPSGLPGLTRWRSSGWGLEKSELPLGTEFVIAVGVFSVELLAYQVSMVCSANWPR